MRKEIDPKIQDAATSYAAQFSDGTTLTHFVAFYLDGWGVLARIEHDERRARAWALANLSYTDSIADPRGIILSDQLYSFTGRSKTTPLFGHRWDACGVLLRAIYTRRIICQSGNNRSPREKRMAFARLWRPSSSPSAHSARFSTKPLVAMARY